MAQYLIAEFFAAGGTITQCATMTPAQAAKAASDKRKAAKAAKEAAERAAYLADRELIAALIECELKPLYGGGEFKITKALAIEYKPADIKHKTFTQAFHYTALCSYAEAMRQVRAMQYQVNQQVLLSRHIAAEKAMQQNVGYYDERMFKHCDIIARKYRIDEIQDAKSAAYSEIVEFCERFN